MSRARNLAAFGWSKIFDQTVAGAAAGTFDVNLQGYTNLRWRLDWLFNAAVADCTLGLRYATDGVPTFLVGGSDYRTTRFYSDIPDTRGFSTAVNGSIGELSNTLDNDASAVPFIISGEIHAGAAARRMHATSRFFGVGPTSERVGFAAVRAAANGKATHLRFMSNIGVNAFDIGTRLIVEAAP